MTTFTSRLSVSAILSLALASACGPSPRPVQQCAGEDRPQLNCESEFKYDGRKVEGGFSAVGLGSANAKTDEVALRQIDKETEQYAAQSRRLCDEYNACVVDKATYSTRAENLRRRMAKAPELYDEVKGAKDDDARRVALARAYHELVPDEARRELALDFVVEAQGSSDGSPHAIHEGDRLATGTRVAFIVRPSRPAYIYLYQKSPDGKVNVLFPDARIATKNPIAPGTALRIPEGGRSFALNDKDIGTERVFIVASLEPQAALGQGGGERVAAIGEGKACRLRALELEGAPPEGGCIRPRGLELDDGPSSGAARSASMRTEAADSVIARVFSFEHVR